jgi:hypothetical protein
MKQTEINVQFIHLQFTIGRVQKLFTFNQLTERSKSRLPDQPI